MIDGLPTIRVKHAADEVEEVLRWGRNALASHPDATRTVFRSLIEEGRRYAKTPGGKLEAERLARSTLAHRARLAWDLISLWLTDTSDSSPSPSNFIDGLMLMADNEHMEEVLQSLFGSADDIRIRK